MDDRGFKDFARVGEKTHSRALVDGRDLDQVLLRVEENDAERFAVEKAHLGTELGDGQRAVDREPLSFLA